MYHWYVVRQLKFFQLRAMGSFHYRVYLGFSFLHFLCGWFQMFALSCDRLLDIWQRLIVLVNLFKVKGLLHATVSKAFFHHFLTGCEQVPLDRHVHTKHITHSYTSFRASQVFILELWLFFSSEIDDIQISLDEVSHGCFEIFWPSTTLPLNWRKP